MENKEKTSGNFFGTIFLVTLRVLPFFLIVATGTGYAFYQYDLAQKNQIAEVQTEFQEKVKVLEERIALLGSSTVALGNDLSLAKDESAMLANRLRSEQEKSSSLESTVTKISGTVGTLEKLSKTDPELLQKYSKVFFLSEHYIPERLADIPKQYLYTESRREQFEQRILPSLQKLLDAAGKNGVTIYIKSAYRSFAEQKELKGSYATTYGAGTANQFSADQGYSEHQLGTTIDFITTGLGGQLNESFDKTAAFVWLEKNAHLYGFTLSYPKNNAYYIYEPWHWRFVGVALATRLKQEGKHFYDLDQREIDKYLAGILD